ncbi:MULTISPECIES: acyl-CoA dehydrogenase [Streptosporangium]|uniref:Alkylation response protein AidB-like acyl-CoA dehydrogenase n=1 Tax=Streptosporangium brasiliense TaxID=47480 RepID=A0ABT9RCU4_9ACTN|nr:acyl-CoA dehydrogenase [Streptosporangium brasiliense]MDP9866677.1 alkylation response protein AidB-like acyl-CoA dehydrogenase [Streptosporangium brasiliense]
MGIGITEEHRALAASVHGFAGRNITARGMDHEPFRAALAAQGLLGLHLPEEHGGQGGGLPELAVALEALGEHCAPGSHLPTVLASAIIARAVTAPALPPGPSPARDAPPPAAPSPAGDAAPTRPAPPPAHGLLAALADGTLTAAVALPGGARAAGGAGGAVTALGSPDADLYVLPLPDGRWAALDRADCGTEGVDGIDLSRRLASVEARAVPDGRVLAGVTSGLVADLAAVLLGAEACGVAAWAVAAAAGHARVREQFGRPIGQFQGVKHRCAAMLVTLEHARAAVWDAARALDGDALGEEAALAAGTAGVLAADAAVRCTADAIQVLGGIGYTYEHDAHLYYRRALSLRALSGDPGEWAERVARLAAGGVRRSMEPDLPEEAETLRAEIRAAVASLARAEPAERLARLAGEGWIMPHLPRPWGRAAAPLEQVVIHQEFRELGRPNLGIAAWAVPSIVRHGTPAQRERFLPRTLTGEIMWCQLFSEPGAGSDLAALSTKAVRVAGGWSLSGQKIWNSLAQWAQWAICLARTDPDAPKHEGITYFLVDMSSPGVTVRPLKEINGEEIFNEVFLDDVFVPDDLVVGRAGQGWRIARDTLSHERVALGDSWGPGSRHTDMVELIGELGGPDALRPAALEEAGRLWASGQALSALGLRVTLSQLSGGDSGTAASVRKLLGMRHSQAVSEFCWSIAPASPYWNRMILTTRAFTIGGGTTEIQLNIIAERALGLPRDP